VTRVYVDNGTDETRIAVTEDGVLTELIIHRDAEVSRVGHIILGRVKTILPNGFSFIDMGTKKNAFANLQPGHGLKAGCAAPFCVQKDAAGTKGMYVVQGLSIRSSLAVLSEDVSGEVGVSRKIADEKEHRRLKKLARGIVPAGHGLILRTAAEGVEKEAIEADVKRLRDQLAAIRARAAHALPPLTLYAPKPFDELLQRADEVHYSGFPPFKHALEKNVALPCGGYITIEQTEACVVIDVNSGSGVDRSAAETNKNAATAIAHHLRLRNLSGIIIVDFISMCSKTEERALLAEMKNAIQNDPARPELHGITSLGLLQITRPRSRPPLSHFIKI
jgi:ribonuclease G